MKFLHAILMQSVIALAVAAHGATLPPTGDSVELTSLGPALDAVAMAGQTGKQGVQIDELTNVMNSTEATGSVSSNMLNSTATGTNIIGDNAFGSTSGVATVIQNTGNQNVIQSSFILNLSVK
jgi:hypothetical protein